MPKLLGDAGTISVKSVSENLKEGLYSFVIFISLCISSPGSSLLIFDVHVF